MKLFSSITGFFRARYAGFVQWVTTQFMVLTAGLLQHYTKLSRKNYEFVQWAATHSMTVTGELVRQHIILSGKNPDYVAPSPPPPQKEESPWIGSDPARAATVLTKFQGANRPVLGERVWIKDTTQHPVLKTRRQFEEKQAALAAQKLTDAALSVAHTEPQPPELSPEEWAEIARPIKASEEK